MKVGDRVTRIEQGEQAIYRITRIIDDYTVEIEPISVAGYIAIGLPLRVKIDHKR